MVNVVAAGGGGGVVGGAVVVAAVVSGGSVGSVDGAVVDAEVTGVSRLVAVVEALVTTVASLVVVSRFAGAVRVLVLVLVAGPVEAVVVPVDGDSVAIEVSVVVLGSLVDAVEVSGVLASVDAEGSEAAVPGSFVVVVSGSGVGARVLVATTQASPMQKADADRRRPEPTRASASGAIASTAPIAEKMMMRLFIGFPFRRVTCCQHEWAFDSYFRSTDSMWSRASYRQLFVCLLGKALGRIRAPDLILWRGNVPS